MRILFVTANPPSPIRVRPYQLIRSLVRRGHHVTVAAPTAGAAEAEDLARLQAMDGRLAVIAAPLSRPRRAFNLAAALPAGIPLQARYAWQPRLQAEIEHAVDTAAASHEPFDLAHVEHLRASAYALRLRTRLPVVWDSVDCITDLFEQARAHSTSPVGRLMTALDVGRTRRYEGWLVGQFPAAVVTSERDRRMLVDLAQGARPASEHGPAAIPAPPPIAVVPNGVDLDVFRPPASTAPPRDPAALLFSGKLSYHANVTAARHLVEHIMPRVWAARPDARVVLAGAEPTRAVRALAAAHPGRVEVTGRVPDLVPYLHRATVAVAPMVYAVGIQNKVLEAMATATPVVATPIATRALGAEPGRHLAVADTPAAFAAAILALLDDPARAAALGAAGRAYVEAHHTWDGAAAALEGVYARAIEGYRGRH